MTLNRTSLVLGLVLAGILLTGCDSPDGMFDEQGEENAGHPGPLAMPGSHGHEYTDLEIGDTFTDGVETLAFATRGVVRVDRVTSVGLEGLRQIGVLLAGDDRRAGFVQIGQGFPPREKLFGTQWEDLGTEIPARPGKRYEHWLLLIGYELEAPIGTREALEIEYTADGRSFVARIPARAAICERGNSDCSARLEELMELAH